MMRMGLLGKIALYSIICSTRGLAFETVSSDVCFQAVIDRSQDVALTLDSGLELAFPLAVASTVMTGIDLGYPILVGGLVAIPVAVGVVLVPHTWYAHENQYTDLWELLGGAREGFPEQKFRSDGQVVRTRNEFSRFLTKTQRLFDFQGGQEKSEELVERATTAIQELERNGDFCTFTPEGKVTVLSKAEIQLKIWSKMGLPSPVENN